MMHSITLNGVRVNFPFLPYDCQKDYMSKVIECLQEKKNGVLESPTGTGKTLCLLCATLAWREHLKDKVSAQKIAVRLGGEEMFPNTCLPSWGTAATNTEPTCYTGIPRIIYASRTHSQLAQVIKELNNTSYRPKICVLGSRDHLCINQEVMRQESSHIKVHMCRRKVSTRSCIYYNNTEDMDKNTESELMNSLLDVEDLVKFGNKQRVCPYYLSRSMKQQADVIFLPYNYLLDPKSRRAHNIELNGTVVIFDEAHNVERTCEEATSFDLTPYDLASAIDAVDRLLVKQAKDASHGESVNEEFTVDCSGFKMEMDSIAKIKQILVDLEAAIDSYDFSSERGITKPGIFIYELMERAHLTYNTKDTVYETLEQIIGYLVGLPGIFLNTSGLQKLADMIQLVFCGQPEKEIQQQMQINTAHFKVHIHRDISYHKKKQSTGVWTSASSKKQGNILSYWCFCPGFSMQDLSNQGVRCIILTSGTLSPLSSFTAEMRIEFPVCLENSHVIERDQIFVSVIDRGPDGVLLSSAFDRRFVPENMASLGNTVANLSRVIPHGLLVFFPSFPSMEKTLDFWRANGHVDRIDTLKPIFVEPKGKDTFTEIIEGYYNKVNDPVTKGGSFFAVCRGKVSEGLDFADTYGRGVIITGLPFPPKMDPRVILKMQFLDEMRSEKNRVKYLSGQQWYRQQAFRAVNQAIGRVIRHREDFGAIFLCDHSLDTHGDVWDVYLVCELLNIHADVTCMLENMRVVMVLEFKRFKGPDARAQLPSWVRPYVRLYDGFGNVVRDVSQFFRVAQKMVTIQLQEVDEAISCMVDLGWSLSACRIYKTMFSLRPMIVNSTAGESCGTATAARSSYFTSDSSSQSSHIYKAKVLDTHLPSLKRRRLNPGETGMITICTEYECEVKESQKKPVNLLDALEQGGHCSGEDSNPVTGEVNCLTTLYTQHDKRMSTELRGGKRKIKLVQEQKISSLDVPEESKTSKAKTFLAEMKGMLSQATFDRVILALQSYKTTDNLDTLLSETSVLTEDANTHSLLRGIYQFVRPHHKKRFHEKCQELTGQGCGFKPDHSLAKIKNKALMIHKEGQTSSGAPTSSQLNTKHLNQGGHHLNQQDFRNPHTAPLSPTVKKQSKISSFLSRS